MTKGGPIKPGSSKNILLVTNSFSSAMREPSTPVPQLHNAATVFAALGDPVRLAIIARLCGDGPLPTIQLKHGTSLSRQAVTKHLRILEDVGLVRSGRVGRDRSWRIEEGQIAKTGAYLEQISAQWEARLERLRALVEDEVPTAIASRTQATFKT
jgi:DNA-binding transcriptional ArsR family regulator